MNSRVKINSFLECIVFFDILILPYMQILIMPWSLPLLLFLFTVDVFRIKNDFDFKIYLGLCICILVSNLVSVYRPNYLDFVGNNTKYGLQLMTSFLYFFYFKKTSIQERSNFLGLIYIYYVYILALAIWFVGEPFIAVEFIRDLYGRTTVLVENFSMDLRFPYFFSDPNSAGYFTLMLFGFCLHSRIHGFNLFLIFLITLLIVFLTQSSGSLVALVLMIIVFILMKFSGRLKLKYLFFILGLSGILFLLSIYLINNKEDFILVESVYERTFNSTDRIESGGGRFYHWNNLLTMYPLPFGRGYTLFDNGMLKPPHSDFLGLIYRYGFISLILFGLFLRKYFRRNLFIMIPAIVCLGINAMLEDQKLFGLFLILVAINSGERQDKYA